MGSSTKRAEKSPVGAEKSAPACVRASGEAVTADQRNPAGKASAARKLPPPPRKRAGAIKPAPVRKPASRAASTPAAAARKAAAPFARKPVFEELEPRFLMSADLNPLATDALFAAPSQQPAEFRALADPGTPEVVTTAAVAPIHRANELVFVDTATPDYRSLVDAMRTTAQAEGINVEFVLIDAERDGVAKITETLGQKRELDAIHVISHARDGAVQLGSTQLDFETLLKRAGQIKSWGNALSEDGDILFYGCDLAASQEGKSLLEALSRLTGADVAASEDKTGAASQGGDWQLEFKTGEIEAPIVVSVPAQIEWDHVLATITVNTTNDAGSGSLRNAITSANGTAANDTIVFNIPTSDPGYSGVTGKFTINLATALPTIGNAGSGNLLIDGWSEGVFLGTAGYNGAPLIMLDGGAAGNNVSGLTIQNAQSTGSEIRGLIISDFRADGIQITAGANNVWIHGNWIGLDATGAVGAGNRDDGIDISATGATIGGPAAADRNVISDNGTFGIVTSGNGTVIRGNYIGTNATGTAQLQNMDDGIRIGSDSNTVTGNVIGFNGHDGLEIADGDSNVVQGNYIGTDPTGTINLAAGSGNADDAIDISGDSDLNTIGGIAAGEGNVLANAFGAGVRSDRPADDTADQNQIRGNSIYNNGDGGILLHGFVQEASGSFDPDTNANQGQNYPSFAGATVSFVGGNLQINNITLSTTANSTYAIDFYANPAGAAGLLLQGKRYLGSVTVSTGATGTITFNATLPVALSGERITATATCTASGTATEVGNTSPFSTTFVTVPPNTAPVNTVPGAQSVPEDTTQAIAGISVADGESNVYLMQLTVTNGVLNVTLVGGATISAGANGTATLTISGTQAAINSTVSSLTYRGNLNYNGPDTLTVLSTDAGSLTDSDTVAITVTAVNDAPVLATGSVLAYTENQAATAINTVITTSDLDNATLASGTVSITGNFAAGQDVLGFVNVPATMGNIAGIYNAGTGVMTLTSAGATATVAQWQAALRAVTYFNSSDAPSALARTVSYRVNDGAANSNIVTSTINVTAVNDAPVLATGSVLAYTENQAATAINTVITTSDLDNATLASGTVSITGNFAAGQDVLGFVNVPATMGNIAGIYNAGTGVMTLTSAGATATVAQWQAALRAVTYFNSSDAPSALARTVSYRVNDGAANSNIVTSTINVTAVNDAPVLATGSVLAYTENQAATAINTVITTSDLDNATLASGTVSITGNFAAGQDVLGFVNVPATMGNIAGIYNAGTGVMTLTSAGATATVAQWQAALRAVTYFNSSDAPSALARTVSYRVNDGAANSNIVTSTINVTAVNDAPVLATGSVLAYTENQAATAINTVITTSDLDNATLASGTVSITGNFAAGQDVLGFVNVPATMGNIAGIYNAGTGVMTLTSAGATATVAQWQAALRAVTYFNSSDAPSALARTVSYRVNDGAANSNIVTSTINVTAVNDAPVLATGSVLAYTENQAATAINTVITTSDLDNATLASGTVSITGNFAAGQDVLGFVNVPATMGNIAGIYNAGTGVMTLTSAGATATVAQWQAALRAVTYFNSSDAPSALARTVSYRVNDGAANSNIVTSTINVTAVNDAPTGTDNTVTVAEDASRSFAAADFGFADIDAGDTLSAVRIDSFSLPVGATLQLSGVNVIAGQVIATAQLGNLVFTPAPNANGAGYASFTFSVRDTGGPAFDAAPNTMTINVTAVNDAPTGTDNTVTVAEDASRSFAAADFGFADIDAGDTLSAVRIDSFSLPVGATLQLSGVNVIAGQVIATAQLGNLVFTPAPNANGAGYASFTFSVRDTGGPAFDAAPNTMTIDVTAVNDAPVLATGSVLAYTENQAATAINTVITTSDLDNATLASGTVSITGNFAAGQDVLGFVNVPATMGNIAGIYNAGTGVMTLTSAGATATVAQWQAALRAVTYFNSSDAPSALARTVSYRVNDGAANSNIVTSTINVTAVNDAPVLATGSVLAYTENQAATAINTVITTSDLDNATLASGTVSITGNFAAGQDVLGFVNVPATMGNIAGIYNAGTGVMTLTSAGATATVAQWQAALRAVTYFNSSDAPSALARTVSYRVNDGAANSNIVTSTINVTAVNDAPTGTDNTVTVAEDASRSFAAADFGFADIDAGDTLSAVRIDSFSLPVGATLQLSGVNVIAGQVIATAQLGNLVFTPAPNANGAGYASFTFSVRDTGGPAFDAAPNTMTIDVTAVNDAPTGTDNTVTVAEDASRSFAAADFGFADIDAGDTLSAVRIDSFSLPVGATLQLSGVNVIAGQVIATAQLGNLVFTPAPNANGAGYASFTFSVRDTGGPAFDAAPNTMTIDVTAVNDAPVLATGSVLAYTENQAATAINTVITTSDLDNATLASGTVSITGNFAAGQDVLGFVNVPATMGNIAGIYNAGTGVMTLTSAGATATVAQWQAALRAVTYFNSSDAPSALARTVSYRVNDGAANSNIVTSTINVTAVNDAPTGTDNTVTVAEDASRSFAAADFGFADIDAGDTLSAVRIDSFSLPVGATLQLSGVNVIAGQVIATAQLGNLVFTPAPNANGAGYASFTFSVRDTGGPAFDAAPNTMTINVTAVNDAPTGTDNTVTVAEDASRSFAAADFGFADIDAGDTLSAVRIDSFSLPVGATLQLSGVNVIAGQVIATAQLGNLVFTPAPNANGAGYASFTFSVRDTGGPAFDAAPNTMTINVTAVNDAPTGTDNTVTVAEDASRSFAAADFGFADIDAGDTLSAVRIDSFSLPVGATLQLSGVNVIAGQVIATAQLGNLVFTPAPNANGAGYASFTFSVRDTGGPAFDAAPNTMTINVTAVNDAPTGTDNTVTVAEDASRSFAAADFGFADIDAGDTLSAVRIDSFSLPVGATLQLSGVNVIAGQVIATAQLGNLVFTPAPNANGAGYASFTFSVRDTGGPAFDAAPNTMTINVTAVNDAPTGTDNTVTVAEDASRSFAAADFGFADIDAGDTLSAVRIDSFSLPVGATLQLSGVNVIAGQVIATAQLGNLVFTPAPNANGAGYASFTFSVRDTGGPAFDAAPNTMTIDVTAVNDAPTGTDNTVTVAEDASRSFAAADFGFADIDAGDTLSAVRIDSFSLPVGATLQLSGVNVIAGQVIATAQLGNLVFTPAPNANGAGYASFTFSVRDTGGPAFDAAPNTMTIDVTAVNDAPTGTDNTVTVAEDASRSFAAADFGFADIDAGDTLSAVRIDSFSLPVGATLQLSGVNVIAGQVIATAQLGNLVFTPAPNANGAGYASFTFSVRDTGGPAFDAAPNTMTIDVTAVNDAPTGTDNTVTVAEDASRSFAAADFGFADIDAGDTLSAVRIDSFSLPVGATLQLSGVNVIAGQVIATAQLGNLVFTPAPNANGAGYASFTFSVRDTGGPAFDAAPNTMTIDVTAVNDAPTGTDNTVTVAEDASRSFAAADFGFADIDAGDTLSAVRIDSFSLPVGATLQLSGVNVIAGQVIATAQLGNLVFTPAPNANGAGYASFTFSVRDTGGPAFDAAPNTMTIDVTAVNDAPTGTDNTVTVAEDASRSFAAADFGFADIDAGDTLSAVRIDSFSLPVGATLQLSGVNVIAGQVIATAQLGNLVFTPAPNANGAGYASFTFSVRDTGGPAFDAAPNTMTIDVTAVNDAPTGTDNTVTVAEDASRSFAAADFGFADIDAGDTLSAVRIDSFSLPVGATLQLSGVNVIAGQVIATAQLGNLVFTPAPNANGAGYASFTFSVRDTGGPAFDAAPNTMTIDVTAVNDAPTGTDNTVTVAEDASRSFAAADFGFADIDAGDTLSAVRIDSFSLPVGATLQLSGVNVIAGQVIATAQLGNLVFTPAPNANGAGYASFTFSVRDTGGPAFDAAPNTMTIDVTAVNDAPTGTDNTVTVAEDASRSFAAADFGFADIDAGDTLSAVRIDSFSLPVGATLQLSGVNVIAGQVIATAQLGNLVFTPAPNANGAGYASFTFSVRDTGGPAFDAAPNTMTINVTAVNDAPTGTDNTVTVAEDASRSFAAADFGFADIDAGDTLSAVRIDSFSLPVGATLQLSGVNVIAGQVIATAQLGNLVFTPAPNANGAGYASFTFSVRDTGGPAFDAAPNTMTIDVTAVNDAPTGTDNTVSLAEDASRSFAAADFGFADIDAGDTLSAVRIDSFSLPVGATLQLSGVNVIAGQVIATAQLGNLVFTPAPNANGAGYASFTFSVRDTGGPAFDAAPNTMTIDVTAVNDAPTGTDNTVSLAEDASRSFAAADFGFADIDAGDTLSAVRIDSFSLPVGATLQLSGVNVIAGQVIATAQLGNLVFTPAPNANGAGYASFTFSVRDTGGPAFDAAPNTMTIDVTAVNDAPTGTDNTVSLAEDASRSFAAADFGFADIDAGDTLSAVRIDSFSLPVGATLQLSGVNVIAGQVIATAQLGNLVFTPAPNANGAGYASFTFSVRDTGGPAFDAAPNTMTIDVTAVNDAPIAVNDAAAVQEDATLSAFGDVLANDTDVDAGDTKTVTLVNGAAGNVGVALAGTYGSVTLNANGSYTYTLNNAAALVQQLRAGQTVTDTFSYQMQDGAGASASANLVVTITGTNDAPVANNDAAAVQEDVTLSAAGDVLANDTDVDAGDTKTVTLVNGAAGNVGVALAGTYGSVTLNANGSYTYTLNNAAALVQQLRAGQTVTDTFSYQMQDGAGASASANLVVTITGTNDAPVNTVPGPQTTLEDVPVTLGGLLVTDPDAEPIQVSLAVANGILTVTLGGGATITAGGNGTATLTLSGTTGQVNAALATLFYSTPADWFGADTLTMTSIDPAASFDTDAMALTVNPVNDAPVPGNNTFTINDGGTLGVTGTNLSATDIDNAAGTLVFTIGGVANGHFELVSAPGAAITTFTQQQILNGAVRFVHDGSGLTPAFSISVSDGAIGVGPYAANILFNAAGLTPPPPPSGGGGSGDSPTIVTPPVSSPTMTPVPTSQSFALSGQGFLRSPAGLSSLGVEGGETVTVAKTPTGAALEKTLVAEGIATVRFQSESIDTTPARTEIEVEPIRAEMQVLPSGHHFAQDDEERQRIEVILGSIRVSGLALSVGAVWWAARAAGLIASLVASAPAWRHVDPLPVLGRDDEEDAQFDAADEQDKERNDEEHRARWVLEGQ